MDREDAPIHRYPCFRRGVPDYLLLTERNVIELLPACAEHGSYGWGILEQHHELLPVLHEQRFHLGKRYGERPILPRIHRFLHNNDIDLVEHLLDLIDILDL